MLYRIWLVAPFLGAFEFLSETTESMGRKSDKSETLLSDNTESNKPSERKGEIGISFACNW